MHIQENVDLKQHSTMRLGGHARFLADAHNENEVRELADWAKQRRLPIITIGGGSNIVWQDSDFGGLIIVNRLMGHDVLAEDAESVTVKIAAGENWDDMVAWTVKKGLSGIETLSLIPGTAGATPVQNVEAYGEQLADTLVEVDAYDTKDQAFEGLLNGACDFSYRSSRFKNKDHGRFIICHIVLKLRRQPLQPPFHRGLQRYIDKNNITDYSPNALRQAVIEIRRRKLPDPSKVANNGSFFKNPVISKEQFKMLETKFPNIVSYPAGDTMVKLSAQWLIEHAGFNAGLVDEQTGMGLWPTHALVFVNHNAKSTADLLAFKQKILDAVYDKFAITLEQEPELLP